MNKETVRWKIKNLTRLDIYSTKNRNKNASKKTRFWFMLNYLHSEGTYLAGIVPIAAAPKPLAVADELVKEVHAQSIVPPTVDVANATLLINGVNKIVLFCASVGNPEAAAFATLAEVTIITPEAGVITTEFTYLDAIVPAVCSAARVVAAVVTPVIPLLE